MEVKSTFLRLSNFFQAKDNTPLTTSELSICLEWLGKAAGMQSNGMDVDENISTTKRQIIELLNANTNNDQTGEMMEGEYTGKEVTKESNSMIEAVVVEHEQINKVEEVKKPVIITRTAQLILEALSCPKTAEPTPPSPSPLSLINTESNIQSIPEKKQPTLDTISQDTLLPSFLFDIGEDELSQSYSTNIDTSPLPSYNFIID